MRQIRVLVCCAVAMTVVLPLPAQDDAKTPDDADALKAKYTAAYKERRKIQYELSTIRRRVEKSEAAKALRKAADAADKAARDAEATNPGILAAMKAERAAYDAMQKAREDDLKANPETAALVRKIEEAEDSRAAMSYTLVLADVKLRHKDSPINRALAENEELAALQRAMSRGWRDRGDYEKARKAYEDARNAALAVMPEGKALLKEIAEAKAVLAEVTETGKAARKELTELRYKRGRAPESKAVTEASARYRAAGEARRAAYNTPELKALADARREARKAHYDGINALVAKDPEGAVLVAKMAEIEKTIRELQSQRSSRPHKSKRSKKRKPDKSESKGPSVRIKLNT